MDVHETLTKAADLIETGWCQGTGHLRFEGADQYCAVGAISRVTHDRGGIFSGSLKAVANVVGIRDCMIVAWNDTPGRTQAEVVAVIRMAADLAAPVVIKERRLTDANT